MKSNSPTGRVYLFQQDGGEFLVKIGWVKTDLEGRRRELQTSSAYPLVKVVDVPGDRSLEAALHRKFAAYHVGGEWFRPSPLILLWALCNFAADSEARSDAEKFGAGKREVVA